MSEVTVVFADLTGSTRVFESLGNAKATQAITRLTQWMGKLCESRQGQVIKYLGDGVLLVFPDNQAAVDAAVEMQRLHRQRIASWPETLKMYLKIGLARGEVVSQDGDCYGDAVNVAARLSDLSGAGQIFATDGVIAQMHARSIVRFRSLGPLEIRGRSEPCVISRIEWQREVLTDQFTVPAALPTGPGTDGALREVAIALRRQDCVLHGEGEIALGAGFEDFSVPTLSFKLGVPAAGSQAPTTR